MSQAEVEKTFRELDLEEENRQLRQKVQELTETIHLWKMDKAERVVDRLNIDYPNRPILQEELDTYPRKDST